MLLCSFSAVRKAALRRSIRRL